MALFLDKTDKVDRMDNCGLRLDTKWTPFGLEIGTKFQSWPRSIV
jgi:hypothetical protein